jgi:hypothetical protein
MEEAHNKWSEGNYCTFMANSFNLTLYFLPRVQWESTSKSDVLENDLLELYKFTSSGILFHAPE